MLEWVIVGGGPHGVHLAIRLLGDAGIDPSHLRIVDPGPRLMHTWHRCTGNTGMTHLRSPGVHHLDLDPFSLLRHAVETTALSQDDALFAPPYNRPSVPLFTEHCEQLIAQYDLQALHLRGRVSDIALTCEGATLTLDDGRSLHSQRVLLALGASDRPRWPAWTAALPSERVNHVFQPGFELDPAALPNRVAVIGGGITGAQVALRLANAGKDVTLVTRHALREHQFDSDPGWVGPKNMRRFLGTSAPEARRQMIREARHLGSLPPDVYRRLIRAVREERVRLLQGEIHDVHGFPGPIRIGVADAGTEVDAVLLATGFETRRPGGALVDQLIESQALPCSTCGYPLVDHHLRWHPRLFVTGPLAELEVGPVARNLIGARRAAERIVPIARERA